MTPTERREAYVERGYTNRHEYLLGLAEQYALDEQTVRLAAHVRRLRASPLEPDGTPVYDIAWELGGEVFVAEI